MEQTINGKSLAEIEKELKKPLPGDAYKKTKDNGFEYLDISYMEDRFFDVIGTFKSDVYVSQPVLTQIGNSNCFISTCRIAIKDDNGNIVTVKEGVGSQNITLSTDKSSIVNIANDVRLCMTYAKKSCYHALKIGVDGENASDSKFSDTMPGRRVEELQNQPTVSEQSSYHVKLTGSLNPRGSKGYAISAVLSNGNNINILIWNDQLNNFISTSDYTKEGFLNSLYAGIEMDIIGTMGSFKNEAQLTFQGIARK